MVAFSPQFAYIPEHSPFLELFPHRGSFLWAEHPKANARPKWFSENRHFLSDRHILQGSFLYGVRFGKKTFYLMLDIDSRSRFHPQRDPFAVRRILEALEPLGLSKYVAVSSSYSGGIHLYFPFWQAQKSHAIARAAAALLEAHGLAIEPGQLELFPNLKRYSESPSEFNGHRLPLQTGSYLLDADWQPCFSSHELFVERWQAAENDCFAEAIDAAIKQFERRRWGFIKADAQKFLNDLNAEIEQGWSSYGQTNRLIGRIALREYVFFHVLHGGEPLMGGRLFNRIIEVAIRLPGYRQWCKHTEDLESVAFYWARSVETSPKYYPYGGKEGKLKQPIEVAWNERKAADARERIEQAVRRLLERGELPAGIKARFEALKAEGIGSSTLYKNKDLWHGDKTLEPAPDEQFPAIPDAIEPLRSPEAASDEQFPTTPLISFISCASPAPTEQGEASDIEMRGGAGGFSTAAPLPAGVEHVRAALASIRQQRWKPAPIAGPPPDEAWFQLQLEMQVRHE